VPGWQGHTDSRDYVAKTRLADIMSSDPTRDKNKWKVETLNGIGKGRFMVGVVITGHPNPPPSAEANPGRAVKWTLIYKIEYEWGPDKKVTSFKVISDEACGHP